MPEKIKKGWFLLCWLLSFISIPLLSFFGRPLERFINDRLTAEAQTGALIIIPAGMLYALLFILRRRDHKKKLRSLLWPGAVLPLILLLYSALPLAEKIHVIVFGFFGFFSLKLFGIQSSLVLCLAMSGLDELLQFFLADRFGEFRDVLLNVLSSCLGIFSAYFLGRRSVKIHGKG